MSFGTDSGGNGSDIVRRCWPGDSRSRELSAIGKCRGLHQIVEARIDPTSDRMVPERSALGEDHRE